jgi:hypothetical protein
MSRNKTVPKTPGCLNSVKHEDAWQGGSSSEGAYPVWWRPNSCSQAATNTCMHSANTRQRATPTPAMAAFRPQRSICLRKQNKKHAESTGVMAARLARLRDVSPKSETSDRHNVLWSAVGVHLAGAGMMAATDHSCESCFPMQICNVVPVQEDSKAIADLHWYILFVIAIIAVLPQRAVCWFALFSRGAVMHVKLTELGMFSAEAQNVPPGSMRRSTSWRQYAPRLHLQG